MAWSKGVKTEPCSEGGMDLASLENGDYIKLRSVDFGQGASSFDARVASANSGGSIEIRLDGETGKLVGTCAVSGTDGWQTWTTKTCSIDVVSGVHDLFLVFKGGSGSLINVNWWKFKSLTTTVDPQAKDAGSEEARWNRATGELVIRTTSSQASVELVSAQGDVRPLGIGSLVRLQTRGIRPGIYLVRVRQAGSVQTRKILLNL